MVCEHSDLFLRKCRHAPSRFAVMAFELRMFDRVATAGLAQARGGRISRRNMRGGLRFAGVGAFNMIEETGTLAAAANRRTG